MLRSWHGPTACRSLPAKVTIREATEMARARCLAAPAAGPPAISSPRSAQSRLGLGRNLDAGFSPSRLHSNPRVL